MLAVVCPNSRCTAGLTAFYLGACDTVYPAPTRSQQKYITVLSSVKAMIRTTIGASSPCSPLEDTMKPARLFHLGPFHLGLQHGG